MQDQNQDRRYKIPTKNKMAICYIKRAKRMNLVFCCLCGNWE